MTDEAIGTRMKSGFAQVWLALLIVLATVVLLLECFPRWLVLHYHVLHRWAPTNSALETTGTDTELRLNDCNLLQQIVANGQPLVGSGHAQRKRN